MIRKMRNQKEIPTRKKKKKKKKKQGGKSQTDN